RRALRTRATTRPKTIDHVLDRLRLEVDRAVYEGSRLGYFAALYRGVTARVAEGIETGRFEDGERMERLDVIFALRYLDAVDRMRRGEAPTRSWRLAFDAADRWDPCILQHLLVGMNAHIGLDLGIAAARTAPGPKLGALRSDFDEITTLLCEMIDDVQDRLADVSPWMWLVDRVGGRHDELVATHCLGAARHLAWTWAEHLAGSAAHRQDDAILRLDAIVAQMGGRILRPSLPVRAALFMARVWESRDVVRVIRALDRSAGPGNTAQDGPSRAG
ncbi:MAG: DUF5995 family protein, partial [Gemmatimonadota bacterium]